MFGLTKGFFGRAGRPVRHRTGNVEIHAWDGCNLSCESCAHYSSEGLVGGPSARACDDWMAAWAGRLRPATFSIVGGEPTMNKELVEIMRAAIRRWPDSGIRLATNGFLLAKHDGLPEVLAAAKGRAYIDISSHHSGESYQAKFAPVRELAESWRQQYGLKINVWESYMRWTRRYQPAGGEVKFPDGEPRLAWEACIGKTCRQIYQGKLWKCPPIAYFDLVAGKRRVEQKWRDLAGTYQALEPDCDDAALRAFLGREEEAICRLCPSSLEHFELPDPMRSAQRVAGAVV